MGSPASRRIARVRRYSSTTRDAPALPPTRLSRSLAPRSRRLRWARTRSWRAAARRAPAYNPARATPAGLPPARFGPAPVRSPLLRGCCLFLGVLRCFNSPGALHRPSGGNDRSGRWVAPFGDRGINARVRLPHAYRSSATSFIGTPRRGIHPTLLVSSLPEGVGAVPARPYTRPRTPPGGAGRPTSHSRCTCKGTFQGMSLHP